MHISKYLETESNAYKFCARTEYIKNNCNPVWNPLEVRLEQKGFVIISELKIISYYFSLKVEDEDLDSCNDNIKFKLEVILLTISLWF